MLELFGGLILSIMAIAFLFYKKRLIIDDYLGETQSYRDSLLNDTLRVKLLTNLLTNVKKDFRCVAGEMNSNFWGQKQIVNKINEFKNKNIQARVLLGPNIDEKIGEQLKEWIRNGVLKVRRLSSREEYHFIVSDTRHFHAEVPHEPFQEKRTGIVVLNAGDREVIFRLENRFDRLWEKGEEISSPEDVEKFRRAHNPLSKNV